MVYWIIYTEYSILFIVVGWAVDGKTSIRWDIYKKLEAMEFIIWKMMEKY